MGGDTNGIEVDLLKVLIEECSQLAPTMLFSGQDDTSLLTETSLDMIKVGAYVEEQGGLLSTITNQRVYRKETQYIIREGVVVDTKYILVDITQKFREGYKCKYGKEN